MHSVLIIGGGVMGGDVATVFASGGWAVHVVSPSHRTREALPTRVKAGLLTLEADASLAANLTVSAALKDVDWQSIGMVVEAVSEDLALKQRLFEEVAVLARPDVPLASNTSNFPISEIGKRVAHPERVLGLHFFMPAHLVPLVEVISADVTDPEVAQQVVGMMKALNKAPIWVKKDVPGFVGNRIQHAMLREALYLIQDGICDADGIDTAVRFGFGFRFIACGPLLQKEMSGWGTSYLVASSLYPHLYRNEAPPPFLKELYESGRLGMKTKRGLWEWTDEKIVEEKARIEKALRGGLAILTEEMKAAKES